MKINKLKNITSTIMLFFALATLTTSCDEVGDLDVGGTNVEAMSGDWWIIALEPDGVTPAYGGDYEQFSTYNTAANDNGLWINDYGHWMEIQTKVVVNLSDKTFAGVANSPEEITGATVSVSNGKITSKDYVTESNTTVDAIEFEAEFSWDPGVVYKFMGHKRTGFAEDENPHYSN